MSKFCLVNIEWNSWNGFVLEVLQIEAGNFDGSLLGLWVGDNRLIIDLLFINFEIKSPII